MWGALIGTNNAANQCAHEWLSTGFARMYAIKTNARVERDSRGFHAHAELSSKHVQVRRMRRWEEFFHNNVENAGVLNCDNWTREACSTHPQIVFLTNAESEGIKKYQLWPLVCRLSGRRGTKESLSHIFAPFDQKILADTKIFLLKDNLKTMFHKWKLAPVLVFNFAHIEVPTGPPCYIGADF